MNRCLRRTFLLLCLVYSTATGLVAAQAATEPGDTSSCPLFLVMRSPDGPRLEAISIAAGQTVVIDDPQVITFVLPYGPGQSGDLIEAVHPRPTLIVSSDGESVRVTLQRADGRQHGFPPVQLADLQKLDIRVSITCGSGEKRAFRIHRYRQVEPDDGPVVDMFGGAVPLQPGDYSITLESALAVDKPRVRGSAPLVYHGGDPLVPVTLPDGRQGEMVLDLGSSGTVIGRSAMPAGAEITELVAVEHSSAGTRELPGEMGGAGGTVSGFLGSTTLERLTVGEIVFQDITVNVVDSLPRISGHTVVGILGLDPVMQAGVVAFSYGQGVFELRDKPSTRMPDHAIALTTAVEHLFVEGEIGGAPVTFLLDTGAQASILTAGAAAAAGLRTDGEPTRKFQGLDGQLLPAWQLTLPQVELGSAIFADVSMHVAELPVLRSLGLQQDGALLGNDFYARFDRVEVDFVHHLLCLWDLPVEP